MSRKFAPKDINAAVAKLPKAAQKKIPKQTKSQDVAGLLGKISKAVNSTTGMILIDLLLAVPAVKDGGKIYKKKKSVKRKKKS